MRYRRSFRRRRRRRGSRRGYKIARGGIRL